ncbi:MAG TPA: enolase C-terminal domain-like protein [Solirubrobacteraceae bacterium]|jgi:L-alanine-DL-glutamate epimerase-like enolase superfamily enzyme|nr:enolase C-terminal domain-like protein [Solirubrobacteraceae bacterium]
MTTTRATTDVPISEVSAHAYTIPTDEPESDGTLKWDSTTLVIVTAHAGGQTGLGWTYGHSALRHVINSDLARAVIGLPATDVPRAWAAMATALRNSGRPGMGSMAIAAVDVALWDLKAKLLSLPLATLLGRFHQSVPIYGSGGFTSYSDSRLRTQLADWVQQGITMVKMKIGREPAQDPSRVAAARKAIGPDVRLFVDANGAYRPAEAIAVAHELADFDVSWFEEPVSSEDLEGLRTVREQVPAGMAIAAGEYGDDLSYFQRMLDAHAVDVLQADVTRCGGISGLLRVDALCRARSRPLSLHCSPTIHGNVAVALETMVHVEYFHDHVRMEDMLFDGAALARGGALWPNVDVPGMGVEFRWSDAERYAA